MKKFLIIILMIISSFAFAGTYSGGAGTAGDPYQISKAADWAEFVATTADAAKYFKVTADIDFGDATVTPYPIAATFVGVFDGDGHTFSNLVIAQVVGNYYTALFGKNGEAGIVKNLTCINIIVDGVNVAGHSIYTAGVVGENHGGVINCHVINGTISLSHNMAGGLSYLGGVIGANHGDVNDCTSSGTITGTSVAGTSMYAGGVVGYQTGEVSGIIGSARRCYSTMTMICTGFSSGENLYVGGIAGGLVKSGTVNEVNDCHWVGTITTDTLSVSGLDMIGGIVGCCGSTVINSSAVGTITTRHRATIAASGLFWVGGAIGGFDEATMGTIDNCYADVDLSMNCLQPSQTRFGGFIGVARTATIRNCYALGSLYDANTASTALDLTAGGFAGKIIAGTITNCFAVTDTFSAGSAAADVNGFCGASASTPTFSGCYWNETTSGMVETNTNGTKKTTTEMQTVSTFSGDYTMPTVWRMVDGLMYPDLTSNRTYFYDGGAGTAVNPYQIKTSKALQFAMNSTTAGETSQTYFKIDGDITWGNIEILREKLRPRLVR